MNAFQRSWEITKRSFGVVKKDKELLLFPILSGIFSVAFSIAMLFPRIISVLIAQNGAIEMDIIEYLLVFLTYLGLALISTFFNVCVVYTAKSRFAGGSPTVGGTFKFAFSKIHLIVSWALVSATVGLIFYIIERIARSIGGLGEAFLRGIRSLLGLAWAILTIFVIPAMVFHNLGPKKAINKSVKTLKKTWGESLIRHYGMGFVQFLVILLGIGIAVGIGFLTIPGDLVTGIIITASFLIIYIMIVVLVFSSVNKVFNTALYIYADTGKVPGQYTKTIMNNAFKVKEKKK